MMFIFYRKLAQHGLVLQNFISKLILHMHSLFICLFSVLQADLAQAQQEINRLLERLADVNREK